jgi:tripartite-type tricarboxylate transporter receptor subunit TctC
MRTARLLLMSALVAAFSAAHAQTGKWPEKPVRVIIAGAPGGGDDFVTRLIAPKLGELLGQQFIAENRAGVGGLIGQTFVQKSAPDGYTWLLAGGSMAGARHVNANATYDVLRDFTPVSLLETSPFVIAEAALPGYDLPAWRSIMGPAGIRRDIVDALNAAIRRTLAMPDIRDKMLSAGSEPAPGSPEELAKRYAA